MIKVFPPGLQAQKNWKLLQSSLPYLWIEKKNTSPFSLPPSLDPQKGFYTAGGQGQFFFSFRNNRPVAMVGAFLPSEGTDHESRGHLGVFDALDRHGAQEVLQTAFTKLQSLGIQKVWGPMEFSTWNSYRFLVDGGESPFFNEPWNPPEYPYWWQEMGFQVLKSYFSQEVVKAQEMINIGLPHEKKWLELGGSFQSVGPAQLSQVLRELYDFSSTLFSRNFAYRSLSFQDFCSLYKGLFHMLWEDNLILARDKEGKMQGFILHYPDYSSLCVKNKGMANWMGKMGFLLHGPRDREAKKRWIMKSLGARPVLGKVRLGLALTSRAYSIAQRRGAQVFIHALMEENNLSRSFAPQGSRTISRYELFEAYL